MSSTEVLAYCQVPARSRCPLLFLDRRNSSCKTGSQDPSPLGCPLLHRHPQCLSLRRCFSYGRDEGSSAGTQGVGDMIKVQAKQGDSNSGSQDPLWLILMGRHDNEFVLCAQVQCGVHSRPGINICWGWETFRAINISVERCCTVNSH